MADYTYMNEDISGNYSDFLKDNNLTPDQFIVLEDLPKEKYVDADRFDTLRNKGVLTSIEETEYQSLLEELIPYMPTSETINKLVAGLYNIQIFLRDEIVLFIEDRQNEWISYLNNFSYKGVYNNITQYLVGNIVQYNGLGYTCIQSNTGIAPNTEGNSDYWILFTIKGEKGDPSNNIYCRGDYDEARTYNLSNGDACVFEHSLYYVLSDGVVGISPTSDTSKWACTDKIIIGNNPPTDTSKIWLDISNTNDTNSGNFKRYIRGIGWKSTGVDLSELIEKIDNHVSNNILHNNYLKATGGANVYNATLNGVTKYADVEGAVLVIKINATNTGSSTLNLNNLGAVQILDSLGNSITQGSLKQDIPYSFCYNGLNFIVLGKGGGGNLTPEVLLKGYYGTGNMGSVQGEMPNNGSPNIILPINGTTNLGKGYYESIKISQSIPTKSSQTYMPTTVNQTIPANVYTTGTQTILGDANLISSNIVNGKSIFGILGSAPNFQMFTGTTTIEGTGIKYITYNLPFTPDIVITRYTYNGSSYLLSTSINYNGMSQCMIPHGNFSGGYPVYQSTNVATSTKMFICDDSLTVTGSVSYVALKLS